MEKGMNSKEVEKTEQLIQYYKEDSAQENLQALVHQMKKTVFLIPAMLPDTPEINEIKQKVKENPGVKINLPKGTAPMPAPLEPALLKNRPEKISPHSDSSKSPA